MYTSNASGGWSAAVPLVTAGPWSDGPASLVVDAEGSWHLLYHEGFYSLPNPRVDYIRYLSSEGDAATIASSSYDFDSETGDVVNFPSLAIDASGSLHATYRRQVVSSGVSTYPIMYTTTGLRKGDLLIARHPKSIVPGFWSHVGIYAGNGQVVEALPAGATYISSSGQEVKVPPGGRVVISSLENWMDPNKSWVAYLRVVTANDETRNSAVSFALEQEGKPYDSWWWQKDANGESWYCSELVWAAYLDASDGQINIEYHQPWEIWEAGITPTEIYLDEDTEVIGGHYEQLPTGGFIIWAKSPVDLELLDPENLSVSKQSIELPGAIYGEDDVDGDGNLEDWIGIPERKSGEYLIGVIAEPDASPTDTYTIEVLLEDDTTTVLAENVQVSDIPSEPYVFHSTVPAAVGGIAELPDISDSSGPNYIALAAGVAAALVALTAGASYAGRRRAR
jgi:uncharacterized protein YycO